MLPILSLQSCKAQNEIEFIEDMDPESNLRYHCMIAPIIKDGEINTYEILNWVDMTSPMLNLIDDMSKGQNLEIENYINNSSGKNLIQITNKLESD